MMPEVPNVSEPLAFVSELCSEKLCQSLNMGLTHQPLSAHLDMCPSPWTRGSSTHLFFWHLGGWINKRQCCPTSSVSGSCSVKAVSSRKVL